MMTKDEQIERARVEVEVARLLVQEDPSEANQFGLQHAEGVLLWLTTGRWV